MLLFFAFMIYVNFSLKPISLKLTGLLYTAFIITVLNIFNFPFWVLVGKECEGICWVFVTWHKISFCTCSICLKRMCVDSKQNFLFSIYIWLSFGESFCSNPFSFNCFGLDHDSEMLCLKSFFWQRFWVTLFVYGSLFLTFNLRMPFCFRCLCKRL